MSSSDCSPRMEERIIYNRIKYPARNDIIRGAGIHPPPRMGVGPYPAFVRSGNSRMSQKSIRSNCHWNHHHSNNRNHSNNHRIPRASRASHVLHTSHNTLHPPSSRQTHITRVNPLRHAVSAWSLGSDGKDSIDKNSLNSSSPTTTSAAGGTIWNYRPGTAEFDTFGASDEALDELVDCLDRKVKEAYSMNAIDRIGRATTAPNTPQTFRSACQSRNMRSRRCHRSASVPTIDRETVRRRFPNNLAMAMELYHNMYAFGWVLKAVEKNWLWLDFILLNKIIRVYTEGENKTY